MNLDHSIEQEALPWTWVGAGVVVGIPLVVVLPVLAIVVGLVCGITGLALQRGEHAALGVRLVAFTIGVLLPSAVYFALAEIAPA